MIDKVAATGQWEPMIRSLQMARGLAALAVTLFHTSGMFADPRFGFDRPFWAWTARGDLGVDFFFVLSGFIIMMAHHRDIGHPERLGNYAFKRFVRIYPMYWIFTLLVVLGAAAIGGVSTVPHRPADVASVTTLIRFSGFSTPVATAWTLFHEMLFYGFFALLIFRRWLGIVALALWFGTVAVLFHYMAFGAWSFLGTLLSAHNLSFLFGIGAYFLTSRLGRNGAMACLVAAAGLIVLTFWLEGRWGQTDPLRLGYNLEFAMLIASVVALERYGRIRESVLLAAIGNASYTLYLCHENIGALALKLAVRVGLARWLDHHVLYCLIVVGIVVFSLVVYRYVEAPLLHLSRRWYARRRDA